MKLTMAQAAALGEEIIRMFDLRESERKTGQYETTWGRKTALGIGLCVERMIQEVTEPVDCPTE